MELMHFVTLPLVYASFFPVLMLGLGLFSFSLKSVRSSKADVGLPLMGEIIERKLFPLRCPICAG
jgi:hypothetical protein